MYILIYSNLQLLFEFSVECCYRDHLILWDLDSGSIIGSIKPSRRECIGAVQDLQACDTPQRETKCELHHTILLLKPV